MNEEEFNKYIKDGAKSRNKEIEELKKRLAEKECFPQKKDGTIDLCEVMKENVELKNGTILKELTEKVKQQAEQIEKMKCCRNCKFYNQPSHYKSGICFSGDNHYYIAGDCQCEKWELAEK